MTMNAAPPQSNKLFMKIALLLKTLRINPNDVSGMGVREVEPGVKHSCILMDDGSGVDIVNGEVFQWQLEE